MVTLNHADDNSIHLCGELDASEVRALDGKLKALFDGAKKDCVLDLEALDLLDVKAVIGMVELMRWLELNTNRVIVMHAPQTLAHTLYRLGALERTGLSLIEPRQEEPYE